MTVGSKAQVFHGTADRTVGGLKKGDLMQTKHGRIVSKKQHAAGKVAIRRLRAAGFVAKKGEFKLFTKKAASKKGGASKKVVASRKAVASKKVVAAKKGGASKKVVAPRKAVSTRKVSRKASRKSNA